MANSSNDGSVQSIVTGCSFCQLGIDESVVFESNVFRLLKNKYPIIEPHYLVIPKFHIGEERDILPIYWNDYLLICKKTYTFFEQKLNQKPLTFINPPQMQSMAHFHRHYVGGMFGVHGVAEALQQYLASRGK